MASALRKPIPVSKYANVQAFQPAPRPVPAPDRKAELERERAQQTRLAGKCDQAARVLDKLEARSARLAAQIKALQKTKAAVDARYTQIEDRVIAELQSAGYDRFHGMRVELTLKNCPLAVNITNEKLIPNDYLRTIPASTAPDKIRIKAALERDPDLEIPGCSLTQGVRLERK